MEIGQRIRMARLEAGLSQRQLCGDTITRNMLSRIENGSALPSIPTLQALAQRLRKPMGFFFGEAVSPNVSQLEQAWQAYGRGDLTAAERTLCRIDDPGAKVLRGLVLLDLAEQAIREQRYPYADTLLQKAEQLPDFQRRALLLRGKLPGEKTAQIAKALPSIDPELLLRAAGALEEGDLPRASALLEAAEDREDPRWCLLRGRAYLEQGSFRQAARCFHQAETAYPEHTAPYLERCYQELEDYRQAYFYACRQKKK